MKHKGSRGPVEPAAKAGRVKHNPVGLDKKTTYPLTKKTSLKGKGANRTLKGTDKRRPSKGVEGWSPKRLEGRYF